MKPAKFKKISRKDLPELPEWWKQALEDAKNSPLKSMTDEEISQLCEELAERGQEATSSGCALTRSMRVVFDTNIIYEKICDPVC